MSDPQDADSFPAAPVRHVLSEIEFDVLWDELRLGPTPVVLRLPSPGRTRAERERIVAGGHHGLRRRGLADLAGPTPELARLLRLLAAPRRQLELRAWFGRPVRALAVERDGGGALAVRRDGAIELRAAGTPAHAVCTTLPHCPGGRGRAVSLPTAALTAMLDEQADAPTGIVGMPSPRTGGGAVDRVGQDDTALVTGLLGARGGRAQVAAAVHDAWGSPHRPSSHVTIVDTPRGRYRLTRAVAADGTDWSTLAPVEGRGLHALLSDLLDEADPAQPPGTSNGPPWPGMPASSGTGSSTTTSGRSSAVTPSRAASAARRR